MQNRTFPMIPIAILLLVLISPPMLRAQQTVTLMAGGDVEWSRITAQPDLYFDNPNPGSGEWRRVPYLNTPEAREYLSEKYTRVMESPGSHHMRATHYDLRGKSKEEILRYPFLKIAPLLQSADITFLNLETPLSDTARWSGAFRTPTKFSDVLHDAGVDLVNIANNHAMDAGEVGLRNTIHALNENGIGFIGAGRNLQQASSPYIVEKNGIRFAFLGYTQHENSGTSSFAQDEKTANEERRHFYKPARSGVAPLDPFLIRENIREIRSKVDYVVVSFHWGVENSQKTHPGARKFAKQIIDAGADIIIGHHPHVPRGIELYKGHPIVYCMGNFIFGHNHSYWMDNYLVRFSIGRTEIKKVEILPVAGAGKDLSQPYLLEGTRADSLLKEVQELSEDMDTHVTVEDGIGSLEINP